MRSISDFILEQETGIIANATTLESAYMEMTLALNMLDAYTANNAIVEYCVENNIAIQEGFGDKVKYIGGKIAGGGKKVIDFIKSLLRNIVNALASDKIEKAIATAKEWIQSNPDEADDKRFSKNTPDIDKLLDDVADFTKFVAEGNFAQAETEDYDRANKWTDEMSAIFAAADSLEEMKKRYEWTVKQISMKDYVAFMQKLKDGKSVVKAKKILADLDKANFHMEIDGKNKPNAIIKQIKKTANMFVKVYDGWYKEIAKKESEWSKKTAKDMSKEQKDERQDFLKDERKRKNSLTESYYV